MRARILVIALFAVASASAEKLPKPDRVPSESTAEQKSIIAAGIALHDAGDFDGAIAKYQQVIDQAPDNIAALHEIGFSYFAKKDYRAALEIARRGARYRSPALVQFHVLTGNCLDELGRRNEALDVYHAAVKQSPDVAILRYNLGLSLMRSEKLVEAKKELQQCLALEPARASAHLVLATIYQRLGYRVPAVLAYTRFLTLEPASGRATNASATLLQLVGGNVTKGDKPGNINITLALGDKAHQDEGDFGPIEMSMAIGVAAGQMKKEGKPEESPFEQIATTYVLIGESLANMKPKGFAAAYYAPFFADAHKRGLVQALVYRALQSGQIDGAEDWKQQNDSKLREFQEWLAAFRWQAKI